MRGMVGVRRRLSGAAEPRTLDGVGVLVRPEDLIEGVADRESFLTFARCLYAERAGGVAAEAPLTPYGPDALGWENDTLESFLEAALACGGRQPPRNVNGCSGRESVGALRPISPRWEVLRVGVLSRRKGCSLPPDRPAWDASPDPRCLPGQPRVARPQHGRPRRRSEQQGAQRPVLPPGLLHDLRGAVCADHPGGRAVPALG